MKDERLEFAIMQYLDGTLPPEERPAIEQLLATDAKAQAILAEFQSLDTVLKAGVAMPAVKWDRLAETLSATVNQQSAAADGAAIDEQSEFAITQYMDAELTLGDRAAMERRLANDVAARHLLDEYQTLDRVVKQAWPLPQVNWDRLGEHLSEAVAESAQRARYSLGWVRAAAGMALAASVLIAIGLAIHFYGPSSSQQENVRVANVSGPAPEPAAGTPLAQVEISGTQSRYSYSDAGVVASSSPHLAIQIAYHPTMRAPQEDPLFQQ